MPLRQLIPTVCAMAFLSACDTLQRGDLLFHIVAEDNNITDVTGGLSDHVAIFLGGDSVLEAIPGDGVTITRISDVLSRESGKYIAGRVKGTDAGKSIDRALEYVGRDYDSLYLRDNDAIYCSELVELSYVDRQGKRIFSTIPMSFHDADGNITSYWTQLYRRNGMDVPEGKPGTNPSMLLKSRRVVIKKLK